MGAPVAYPSCRLSARGRNAPPTTAAVVVGAGPHRAGPPRPIGSLSFSLAPGKVPKPVLRILYDAMSEAGKDPELQAKVRLQGINPRDVGLDRFDAHIREDMARLAPILQSVAEKR